ncbi:MAG: IPT/TIG domain-containing protein [Cyclobacteriaceae bacterium]|jgi:hypothetical protein|nr:IPT/TIG domain-containing protein [Cyclobacteriaceae bacterium]
MKTKILSLLAGVLLLTLTQCKEEDPELVASLSGLNITQGRVGDEFVITGTHFGTQANEVKITLSKTGSSAEAVITALSDTEVKATVPNLPDGEYDVKVKVRTQDELTLAGKFTIFTSSFTGFTPLQGSISVNNTITIAAEGLGTEALASYKVQVYKGNVTKTYNASDKTTNSITFSIPANDFSVADEYNIRVSYDGGAIYNLVPGTFSINEVFSTASPLSITHCSICPDGFLGELVTVTGLGFNPSKLTDYKLRLSRNGIDRDFTAAEIDGNTALKFYIPVGDGFVIGGYTLWISHNNGLNFIAIGDLSIALPIPPTFTGISPESFNNNVVTEITISGINFNTKFPKDNRILIRRPTVPNSPIGIENFTVVNSNTIKFNSFLGMAADTWRVEIKTNPNQADYIIGPNFTVILPPPSITSLSLDAYNIKGTDQQFILLGSGFNTNNESHNLVKLIDANNNERVFPRSGGNPTALSIMLPGTNNAQPLALGVYTIKVSNDNGVTFGETGKTLTVLGPTSVTGVTPATVTGYAQNPVQIVITGDNLLSVTKVKIDSNSIDPIEISIQSKTNTSITLQATLLSSLNIPPGQYFLRYFDKTEVPVLVDFNNTIQIIN